MLSLRIGGSADGLFINDEPIQAGLSGPDARLPFHLEKTQIQQRDFGLAGILGWNGTAGGVRTTDLRIHNPAL